MKYELGDPEYRLGHVAFDAYRDHTNGLTHDGRAIPEWRDLGESVQMAWVAAGVGVQYALKNDKRV